MSDNERPALRGLASSISRLSVRRRHLLRVFFFQIEIMLKMHAHMPRNAHEIIALLFLVTESRRLVAQFRKGVGDRSFDLIRFGVV
jgi:hypothetical protein